MDKVTRLHDEILAKVKEYYEAAFGEKKDFRPGVDKVNYAGRVFDEKEMSNELFSIIALNDKALATSGNYRNYYVVDSVRYSHTIDPRSGYPVQHGLLSATVVAPDCMTADAYATALMVMGTENAITLLDQVEELEAFLIYNDDSGRIQTYVSESLKPYISTVNE